MKLMAFLEKERNAEVSSELKEERRENEKTGLPLVVGAGEVDRVRRCSRRAMVDGLSSGVCVKELSSSLEVVLRDQTRSSAYEAHQWDVVATPRKQSIEPWRAFP
jgi:hypothetical protein